MSQNSITTPVTTGAGTQKPGTPSGSKAEVLIPVEIKRTAEGDSIKLNKHDYRIDYSRRVDRQALSRIDTQQVVVTRVVPSTAASANLSATLQLLGNTYNEPIPAPLQAYIKGNRVNLAQLTQLATRVQGYPLGEAKVVAGMVSLAGALAFTSGNSNLPSGTYSAAIIMENGQLQLSLTTKLDQIAVTLLPVVLNQAPKQDVTNQQLLTLPSLTSTYSQLSQQLAALAVPQSQIASLQTALSGLKVPDRLAEGHLTAQRPAGMGQLLGPITAPSDALSKTNLFQMAASISTSLTDANRVSPMLNGISQLMLKPKSLALPVNDTNRQTVNTLGKAASPPLHRGLTQAMQQMAGSEATRNTDTVKIATEQSLLSLVKQQLALAFPRPLADLAVPSLVQRELIDTLAGITPPISNHTLGNSSHSGTIAVLFQLLLGRNLQQNTQVDANKYLQQLQRQIGVSSTLLRLLDKAGTGESMGKLLSGLSLYQQASSDNNQGINWYFALPYTLDNKQEELEGHFEQTPQDSDKHDKWRLQLKFNLSSGSLLINADIKQQQLSLSFTADSKPLLTTINLRLESLQQKLSSIGMQSVNIVTQQSQVPASLLPGEHYLVKIKA